MVVVMAQGFRLGPPGSGVLALRRMVELTLPTARPAADRMWGMEFTDDQLRDWVRRGLGAVGAGALALLLAISNFPLLVLWLVSLVLSLVPGLGLVTLPVMTAVVRARADLQRRLAASSGVHIARPYRPRPQNTLPGGWRRYKWILSDPATWRDLAWLLPGAVVGLGLGVVSLALPLYGIEGILLIPLWIWLGTGWYGYGVTWAIESVGDGFLARPQGALFLLLGLGVAP